MANVHGDNVHSGTSTDLVSTHGKEQVQNNTLQNPITREQCGQLMDLLQHFQNENTGEDSGNSSVNTGSMNFVGPFNEEASGAW
ncbi:hypothetical protein KY289_027909 [Solanum tuberosum]|nr:hypothetical protein KY289_027909 [Solanum tuberosum]